MPEEYKQKLRKMLSDIFEDRVGFMFSALNVSNEITYTTVGSELIVGAPANFGAKFVEFFRSEGLSVKEYNKGFYLVSIVC